MWPFIILFLQNCVKITRHPTREAAAAHFLYDDDDYTSKGVGYRTKTDVGAYNSSSKTTQPTFRGYTFAV